MANGSGFYQQRALVEESAALLGGTAADFSCAFRAGIGDSQRSFTAYPQISQDDKQNLYIQSSYLPLQAKRLFQTDRR